MEKVIINVTKLFMTFSPLFYLTTKQILVYTFKYDFGTSLEQFK